jgi:glycogen(starch) synthase
VHIALLGPVAPPAGGVQSHMSALRQQLVDAGHQVSLIAITKAARDEKPDTFYPSSALDLLKIVLRIRPDVVHLHFGGDLSLRLAALCGVVGLLPRVRSVLTFHSGGFPQSPRGVRASRWSLEGFALRRLDAAIAVNSEISELFRRYGLERGRIHVIAPHARVDPTRIASQFPVDIAEFFQKHSPVFVSVGLLEPEYSLELQVDAMDEIRKVWKDAGLILIGSGSLHNSLRVRIDASPEREHIHLAGNADHSVALRAIRDANVLLRTTKFDGDAVSVREALQLGTRVVASDTGMRPAGVTLIHDWSGKALVEACRESLDRAPTTTAIAGDELFRIADLYRTLVEEST